MYFTSIDTQSIFIEEVTRKYLLEIFLRFDELFQQHEARNLEVVKSRGALRVLTVLLLEIKPTAHCTEIVIV